jgi:hypothetical protein
MNCKECIHCFDDSKETGRVDCIEGNDAENCQDFEPIVSKAEYKASERW